MEPIKVEIGKYRAVNKGALKGTFSLVIYPHGQKLLDCKHFGNASSSWWTLPSKEIKGIDGGKSDFIPIVSYTNKEYSEALKAAVLAKLKEHIATMSPSGSDEYPTSNDSSIW